MLFKIPIEDPTAVVIVTLTGKKDGKVVKSETWEVASESPQLLPLSGYRGLKSFTVMAQLRRTTDDGVLMLVTWAVYVDALKYVFK
jgi:hypothetical protein